MHTDSHGYFGKCVGLCVCLLAASAGEAAPASQPSIVHRLRISLVAEDGETGETDSFANPNDDGQQVRVFRQSILDERYISAVAGDLDDNNQLAVTLQLTDAGSKIFREFTASHLRRRVAVVLDDKIIDCATINTVISAGVMITLPDGFTGDAADKLVRSIRAAMVQVSTQPVDPR
jgi:preprotein translocase subunit SecD